MDINIFILCYNESVLLPHTIAHYKKYLPSCKITIYDNYSTDNSVEIAKSLGCDVVYFDTQNIHNEFVAQEIKNNRWKKVESGWILVLDLDEWLCVTEEDLENEMKAGTTILDVVGINMIGESKNIDLSDIDLHTISKFQYYDAEDKKLCFLRDSIFEMNYTCGAHKCNPVGHIQYSSKKYYNKHMYLLGLDFVINKMKNRYERNEIMRGYGMNHHYTDNIEKIKTMYQESLSNSKLLGEI